MQNIDVGDIIKKSFERTVLILFKPFTLKKWLMLLFIAWLAGALAGGGNFDFRLPIDRDNLSILL